VKNSVWYAKMTVENTVHELLQSLPRNLHKDKQQQQQQLAASTQGAEKIGLSVLDEEEENREEESEEGLVVAWQYRKDVQAKRLGLSPSTSSSSGSSRDQNSLYCFSYDLQGRLSDQMDIRANIAPMGCCCCRHKNARQCGFDLYRQLVQKVGEIRAEFPRRVIRVLLLDSPRAHAVALPLFLNHVRLQQLPVVVFVSLRPGGVHSGVGDNGNASCRTLQRCADVVLETECFVARRVYPPPPEFRHLHGLLKVRKASTCTLATAVGHFCDMTVQKRPAADLYGLQRDRRKLHIKMLHIPPEDFAADGGSVGAGAVRSGAGRPAQSTGCGSGHGSSVLDF
jgi:PAXNEB protein